MTRLTFDHEFDCGGEYVVRIVIRNPAGDGSRSARVSVVDNSLLIPFDNAFDKLLKLGGIHSGHLLRIWSHVMVLVVAMSVVAKLTSAPASQFFKPTIMDGINKDDIPGLIIAGAILTIVLLECTRRYRLAEVATVQRELSDLRPKLGDFLEKPPTARIKQYDVQTVASTRNPKRALRSNFDVYRDLPNRTAVYTYLLGTLVLGAAGVLQFGSTLDILQSTQDGPASAAGSTSHSPTETTPRSTASPSPTVTSRFGPFQLSSQAHVCCPYVGFVSAEVFGQTIQFDWQTGGGATFSLDTSKVVLQVVSSGEVHRFRPLSYSGLGTTNGNFVFPYSMSGAYYLSDDPDGPSLGVRLGQSTN